MPFRESKLTWLLKEVTLPPSHPLTILLLPLNVACSPQTVLMSLCVMCVCQGLVHDALVVMVATVSPAASCYEDTHQTLLYAERLKAIPSILSAANAGATPGGAGGRRGKGPGSPSSWSPSRYSVGGSEEERAAAAEAEAEAQEAKALLTEMTVLGLETHKVD